MSLPCAVMVPLAHRLLGTHVVRRPEGHPGLWSSGYCRCCSRCEVQLPKSATSACPSCSRMFSGLMVAVNHLVPVGIVERAGHFSRDPYRFAHGGSCSRGSAGYRVQRFAVGMYGIDIVCQSR